MYHVLLDSTGNLIESFQDNEEAQGAMRKLVAQEPGMAANVALITYDDAGRLLISTNVARPPGPWGSGVYPPPGWRPRG